MGYVMMGALHCSMLQTCALHLLALSFNMCCSLVGVVCRLNVCYHSDKNQIRQEAMESEQHHR